MDVIDLCSGRSQKQHAARLAPILTPAPLLSYSLPLML